jgi:DNA invertase Pin-like site-specific DNA recombinase
MTKTQPIKITALYSRNALADDITIKKQELALQKYAAKQRYGNCVYYSDNGDSGLSLNRPAMRQLLCDIRDGRIERVIARDLARLSRNCIEIHEFLHLLSKHNIECETLDGHVYRSNSEFEKLRELFLQKSWEAMAEIILHPDGTLVG